jgi:hypothetical protein
LNDKSHDLSGEFVLVSTQFCYFGKSPLEVPDHLRPEIPVMQSPHGFRTHDSERALEFINFVTENFEVGVHNAPHKRPRNDMSWKSQ